MQEILLECPIDWLVYKMGGGGQAEEASISEDEDELYPESSRQECVHVL